MVAHLTSNARAQHSGYPNGFADVIKQEGNAARDSFLKQTADGAITFLTSGFGKGLLAVAGIAIIGGALLMGGLAGAGAIDWAKQIAPNMFENAGKMTITQGLMTGASMGFNFLTTPLGFAIMGGASIVSGIQANKKHHDDVAAAMATAEARAQAKAKAASLEMNTAADISHDAHDMNEKTTYRDKVGKKAPTESFVKNEINRANNNAHYGVQGVV